ncbi:MAG TPA: HEPN domain-containing protein [Planctomycetota bacterium]|nr:HEPN domain-containing protein [Planctomycetota bacterium]HRR83145.1 HEPN domain-containing protein [Planctomycetota bacterium]
MTPEQRDLLVQARESPAAGKAMRELGHHGYAASRAYYTMFHVVQALLLGKGLAFSKHSAVHAAFGQHFAKAGVVPADFHRYLIRGMEARHAGDYGKPNAISPSESAEQLSRAQDFLDLAGRLIGPLP